MILHARILDDVVIKAGEQAVIPCGLSDDVVFDDRVFIKAGALIEAKTGPSERKGFVQATTTHVVFSDGKTAEVQGLLMAPNKSKATIGSAIHQEAYVAALWGGDASMVLVPKGSVVFIKLGAPLTIPN
jgi:hypothetical protein